MMKELEENVPVGNLSAHDAAERGVVPADLPDIPAAQTRSGVRAVARTVVSKFGITVLNAGTGMLTARMLMTTGRGELTAMILSPTLLSFLTTLGMPSAVIYLLKKHDNQDQAGGERIVTAFSITLIVSTLSAIVGTFVLPYWLGRQYSTAVVHAANLFLYMTPIMALGMTGRAVLEAKSHFAKSNQLLMLAPATTLGGLIIVGLIHRMTPFTAGICYMFGAVPPFLLMLAWIFPLLQTSLGVRFSAYRELVGYGIRSFGIDLLGTLALQVDQVLVISMLRPGAMGSYVVMLSVSRMFNLFQASVVMVLFPKAAGLPAEKVLQLAELSARMSTLITGMCCAVTAVIGVSLLRILYGAEYAVNVQCLRVLLLEVTISGTVFILAQAFMALGHPGVVTVLQGLGLCLTVPLMFWLVPWLGILGAALALLLSTCARLFLFIWDLDSY